MAANGGLLGLLVLHSLDHGLLHPPGTVVPDGASALGVAGFVVVGVALLLALASHRLAPEATALVGFATAGGFVLVHVLPDWGPISQPYEDIGLGLLSWAGLLVTVAFAAGVGVLGLRARNESRTTAKTA